MTAGRQPVGRWEWWAIGAIVLVAALLRLWNVDQNLPLVYNIDENARFVPDAARFFQERLDYRELVNPPGMMVLLSLLDHVWFGVQGLSPTEGLDQHPTQAYLLGRLVAALMSTAAIPVLWWAGRILLGRLAAIVAAALLAVAFLPVAYSRLALSDGPTVLFLAVGILGAAWILRDGDRRGYLAVGVAVGLAAGFKYNAGIVVLVGLAAAALRLRADGRGPVLRRTVVMGVVALVAFVVSNPYVLIDPHEMWRAIEYQQKWATSGPYVGEPRTSGFAFYAWAATWGVGWLPTIAALVGSLLLLWWRRPVAALLLPLVALYLLIMGGQDRFFARWMLPIVPVMCLAAGFAVAEVARLVRGGRAAAGDAPGTASRDAVAVDPGDAPTAATGAGDPARSGPPLERRPAVALGVAALLTVALGAQSLVHAAHTVAVVGRDDTRTVLRDWLLEHVPAGDGVVLESMSPAAWQPTFDGRQAWFSLTRWSIYHSIPAVQRRDRDRYPRQTRTKAGFSGWVGILYPELVDRFQQYGYCWVVTSSYQAGRAARTPYLARQAVRFYRELARRGTLVHQISPFARDATGPGGTRGPFGPLEAPVKYQIDRQATTYELAYDRPGPLVSVYRLTGGRCAAPSPVIPSAPLD
ncbi:glycosyltransferase family 39 protein [Patulibacter brassicae]|uniref:Glycosyltransferase family 39 protein n=1 Tax=Patulibacter brassicae TaxID=1705717 RepID=A0ABU4VI28_9ACTN|nr:glycosyltransferase family 39 protein [Patulibacter brassicae]MDX8151477.1 glycosyltransferase family 39 protein [Patulibacter brassicae]